MAEFSPLIYQLPLELLLQVWEYLDIQDVFAFRLVCRHLNDLLFDSFCQEFYAERRFSITYDSLMVLVKITRDDRLRRYLTRLTIGLDRLDSSDALPRFIDPLDPVTHVVRELPILRADVNPHKLDVLYREQNFLISSGKLQLFLSEVLGNLSRPLESRPKDPRLEELALRDQNVRRKVPRNGANPLLVSYGSNRILQETGINFTNSSAESHLGRHDVRFVDSVFSSLMLAIAQSGLKVDRLTVDIQKGDVGLSSSAFIIPAFFSRDIEPALLELRKLDLSVSFKKSSIGSYSNRPEDFLPWQEHQVFSFLQQTPNLAALRVQAKQQGHFTDGLISGLANLTTYSEHGERPSSSRPRQLETTRFIDHHASSALAPTHRFEALEELELGNMRAQSEALSRIIRHLSKSLRRLKLSRIALIITKTDPELENDRTKPNAWSALFLEMCDLVELEHLTVAFLEHHTPSCSQNNGHTVAFLPSAFGTQSGELNGLLHTWTHESDAEALDDFLRVLSQNTIIICRKCKERNSGYRSVDDILVM
ncbi:hypothetical protein F5Y16DRAFT_344424 [Xylariaceae sp. FL0255]|nr:hypothetical protein F5Y16DRAFT_344424 [Xylariaceae sp. FL0255]